MMKNSSLVLGVLLLLILVGCGVRLPEAADVELEASAWPNPGFGPGAITKVLGSTNDFTGAIALQSGQVVGAYGWWFEFSHTGYERPGDPTGFWPYAQSSQLPDAGAGFLRWRSLVPYALGAVFVPGDSTYFAVEYKDNLLSPRLNPRDPGGDGPSVRIGNTLLGQLEAKRDHKWKRTVFAIPAGTLRETDGRYRIIINDVYGSTLIHRLIVAKGPIPARVPKAGFWPSTTKVLSNNKLYDRARKSYVPIIVDVGFGQLDVNQIDALDLIGANTNLSSGNAYGSGRNGWAPSDFYFTDEFGRENRMMGVPTNMNASITKGYFAVPWVYTDTQRNVIECIGTIDPIKIAFCNDQAININFGGPGYHELYNTTWRGVLRVWEKALQDLVASNPKVPFIYLKDEWDHQENTWGSLEEQIVEMRSIANRIAPGVPTAVTAMGWKPLMHLASFDLADIVMSDRYPVFNDLQEVAEWAEEMRRVANGKPFMNVLPLTRAYGNVRDDPSQWNSPSYLRSGTYMSLIHGGKGIWWFGEPAGMLDQNGRNYYASLKPVTQELRLLRDVLHGSATELGRTIAETRDVGREQQQGASYPLNHKTFGDGTSSNPAVSTSYRQSARRKVLLSVNEWILTITNARINVSTLQAGDTIKVLFENRSIIAQNGFFVDTFSEFQRHVYEISP
jgi:hypothetical protein